MNTLSSASVAWRAVQRHGGPLASVLFTVLFMSCSSGFPAEQELRESSFNVSRAPYSMVIIIHGDGEYQYYNADGVESSADIAALRAAQRTAEQNPFAEVFIFHQQPQRTWMMLFPGKDGEFYYYRYGRMILQTGYRRSSGRQRFDPETALYHRYRLKDQVSIVRMLLYFGHEIPEIATDRYDGSHPDRLFSIDDLAEGLKGFQQSAGGFDLLALSTCYGGSPLVISALAPYARYIIASPDNLHLSYFDLNGLEHLEQQLSRTDLYSFAKTYSRQSFDRLINDVQTTVSIVLYDTDKTKEYRDSVQNWYVQQVSMTEKTMQNTAGNIRRCDCADLPGFPGAKNADGVDVWYRSERFGRDKHKTHHSGWECWKTGPQASAAIPDTGTVAP